MNRRSITAIFIFDSCYSGGIARLGGAEIRSLPGLEESARPSARDETPSLRTDAVPSGASAVVILTASNADEPAQGSLHDGRYQGVFTTAFHDALLPADGVPPVKWSEVLDGVVKSLTPNPNDSPIQTPHVYGAKFARIFDSDGPFSNAIDARLVSSTEATLLAGSDVGITKGSAFKLFGQGQVPWRGSPDFEATAEVTDVTPQSARLRPTGGVLKSASLAAVESYYALPDGKIKVQIPRQGDVDPFDRAAVAAALGDRAEITDVAPELVLSSSRALWKLATADGKDVGTFSAAAINSDDLGAEIGQRFVEYARWRRLSAWKRPGLGGSNFVIRLKYQASDGPKLLRAESLKETPVPSGVPVQLIVENRGAQRVRIDVLLLPAGLPHRRMPDRRCRTPARVRDRACRPRFAAGRRRLEGHRVGSDAEPQSSVPEHRGDGALGGDSLEDEFARLWNGVSASSRSAQADSFWNTVDIPFKVIRGNTSALQARDQKCIGIETNE